MNKEKLRLINILKRDEEIKTQIEEKENILNNILNCYYCNRDWSAWNYWTMTRDDFELLDWTEAWEELEEAFSIIEERHLRMFCSINKQWLFIEAGMLNFYQTWNPNNFIIFLDLKKPFSEQSEEFYKKLNDFLEKEFNIN